jgi:tRNA isopentenyl-2-thiomethyl-A-37 hydroxylase MiaE
VATAESEWPAVYTKAMTDARESRLSVADSALVEFARRHPTSPEALEVPYWRALLKLDPSNPIATRESLAMLDSYLAHTPAGQHRMEADAIKRLAATLEARNTALAAIPPSTVARPEEKAAQEAELQRLRDELAKANAELARIRRRLARPRP